MFQCVFPQAKELSHEKNTDQGHFVLCRSQSAWLASGPVHDSLAADTTIGLSSAHPMSLNFVSPSENLGLFF
jgi:hypothetical protein